MLQDASFYITMGAIALLAVAIISAASLRGWREWIALKHAEIETHKRECDASMPTTVSRIEVADLKERVRKLEAIAAGIDM